MKHQRPPQPHEQFPIPNPFAAQAANSLTEALGKGASLFGRGFATMQKESMRFANQRLEENMKAFEELGACRSLPDVFAAQQRWFAEMTRAYTAEWKRYSEMMSEVARENIEEAEAEMHRPARPDAH